MENAEQQEDKMMMANLPPVMLPTLHDYGMLAPTLGIKVNFAYLSICLYSFRFDRAKRQNTRFVDV